jgi:hypothetical protein
LVLYDIKKDYQKCLRILLKENVTGHELSLGRLQDAFMWIVEKHEVLRRRMIDPKEDTPASYQFKVFEREVLN